MTRSAFRCDRLPPARTYWEREIGKLSRADRRGWAKANCVFHKSKSRTSFSVNVENGAFYCHGCGVKGGDLVAFVMLRDNLNFKAAAQSLGAWDEAPSPEDVRKWAEQARERDRQRQAEEARQSEERRRRLELRDELYTAARLHREACERLGELRRGVTPTSDEEEEACWAAMSLAFEDLHDTEAEYCAAAGLEYDE